MIDEHARFRVAVLANDEQFKELSSRNIPAACEIIRLNNISEISTQSSCLAFFDLLFEPVPERFKYYAALRSPVFINCVELTNASLQEIANASNPNVVRINAWPGFISRPILELAESSIDVRPIFEKLPWLFENVPDTPGMVSARIISMIINEAYLSLGERVSTKPEIDTAMKLGTNYPYGPFEWAGRIGIERIYQLLSSLAKTAPRYAPAPLLKKEALQ